MIYRGLPKIHIDRNATMQRAADHGYLPIQSEDSDLYSYIVDRDEKVIAVVTSLGGYLKVPVECINGLVRDLEDIKEIYLGG